MATILDLFKSRKEEIYGGEGTSLFIESQGVVNVPRKSALLASSPNAIGGLIGNEVGGLLKGSANRVSDTIFKGKESYRKPLIINPAAITRGLRYAVEEGEEYYVKRTSDPQSFANRITQGVSTPGSLIQQESAKFLKNPNTTVQGIKNIGNKLKQIAGDSETFGPRLMEDKYGVLRQKKKTFSEYVPVYGYFDNISGEKIFGQKSIKTASGYGQTYITDNIIRGINNFEKNSPNNFDNLNKDANIPFVMFETYGNGKKILLPGTITGLSEEMTPDWTDFKYVGSPFKLYRYGGVERSIRFNLKLYYTERVSKLAMISNLNKLRKLVFPADELSAINYASNSSAGVLAIKPNLVWLTIADVYKKILGVIDSLSFTIDDNTSWSSTFNEDVQTNEGGLPIDSIELDNTGKYDSPYPSVIDVSISMKIIESPIISNDNDKFVYEYADDDSIYFADFTDLYKSYNKETQID